MGISLQKAQAFKNYVSNIPTADRQQFIKTYQNLSPAGQAEAVGRAVGFDDNSNSMASNIGNAAIVGGGTAVVVAGCGVGVGAGADCDVGAGADADGFPGLDSITTINSFCPIFISATVCVSFKTFPE